eukprot:2019503-Pleurochrysis_carterae.AAC.3
MCPLAECDGIVPRYVHNLQITCTHACGHNMLAATERRVRLNTKLQSCARWRIAQQTSSACATSSASEAARVGGGARAHRVVGAVWGERVGSGAVRVQPRRAVHAYPPAPNSQNGEAASRSASLLVTRRLQITDDGGVVSALEAEMLEGDGARADACVLSSAHV